MSADNSRAQTVYRDFGGQCAKRTEKEQIVDLLREGREQDVIEWFEAEESRLHSWVPWIGTWLHAAVWLGKSVKLVEYLLVSGIDVNTPREDGKSPLHLACASPEAVRTLLAHGADANAQDAHGRTPLHEAVGMDLEVAARILIEAGADLNLADEDGRTPLDLVYDTKYLGYRELAEFMQRKGATRGKGMKKK